MKISSKARYAIQSMLQLAMQVENKPITLAELTEQQGISTSYLEQLLASLRDSNLVVGVRGPGGGYRIAGDLADINIGQILMAVHETHLTRPPQSGYGVSVYNDMWWDLSEKIQNFLSHISLAELMDREDVQSYLHQQRLFMDTPFTADDQPEMRKQA